MESIRRIVWEDPVWVYVLLAGAELILLALWFRHRQRRWALGLLAPPILAAGAWALATMVVTDRERIHQAVREIAADYQAGQLAAAETYLDEAYIGFGGDKPGLLTQARAAQNTHAVRSIKITRAEIDVQGRFARMEITTLVRLPDESGGGTLALAWKIDWVKRSDGWRIETIETPETVVPGFEP